MRTVSVLIAERPVQEDRYTLAFTVVVFDGFGFADANVVPPCVVYKRNSVGPLIVHATPVLVKRPATVGLYDGSFAPSVIAPGGAPETYLVTAEAYVGLDQRTWGEATMSMGPVS
jgi:hypothetical protein